MAEKIVIRSQDAGSSFGDGACVSVGKLVTQLSCSDRRSVSDNPYPSNDSYGRTSHFILLDTNRRNTIVAVKLKQIYGAVRI